jgi:DNA invertase Pin-like site-specific DNA recombinase
MSKILRSQLASSTAVMYLYTAAGGPNELALQEEQGRQYCHVHGLTIEGIYCDRGKSRARLADMMAALEAGRANCLVVADVDRLGRDMRSAMQVIELWDLHTVRHGKMSILDVHLDSLCAERERHKHSERIARGRALAKWRREEADLL